MQEVSLERRREHRQRVIKGATIIAGLHQSEVGCVIRNQHSGGAELKVGPETHVPTSFLLYVPTDGVAYRCDVKWRRNDRVGVLFTGIEPKPQRHYG